MIDTKLTTHCHLFTLYCWWDYKTYSASQSCTLWLFAPKFHCFKPSGTWYVHIVWSRPAEGILILVEAASALARHQYMTGLLIRWGVFCVQTCRLSCCPG